MRKSTTLKAYNFMQYMKKKLCAIRSINITYIYAFLILVQVEVSN